MRGSESLVPGCERGSESLVPACERGSESLVTGCGRGSESLAPGCERFRKPRTWLWERFRDRSSANGGSVGPVDAPPDCSDLALCSATASWKVSSSICSSSCSRFSSPKSRSSSKGLISVSGASAERLGQKEGIILQVQTECRK